MKRTPAAELKAMVRATFLAPNNGMSDAQRLVLSAFCQKCAGGQSPVVFDATGRVDEHATLVAVGRQEVWLWLNQLLGIPDTDVAALAAHRMPLTRE